MSNAVISDWPSGSANTGWPGEPTGMLMPGRVQGWPAGTQRAANAAERLLTQAVAYWDVAQYREGGRFLRNRGTGGELLDLRLGSSIVANSNDPLYLEPMSTGYVYVPGSNSNALTVPDENALDLQDIEIVARFSMEDWTPSANTVVISKGTNDATCNYRLFISASGGIRITVSDGASSYIATSTNPALTNGTTYWIKATRVASTGLCSFYYAADSATIPSSWTTVSENVASGYTGALNANTVAFTFGGATSTSSTFAGRLHRSIIRSSVGGSTVLDIDCDAITSGSASTFTALTGQTVTINRSTSGRKSVAVPSRSRGGQPVMLLGSDDFLEVQDNWQHGLLNFQQGDSFTVLAVVRQWGTPTSNGRYLAKTNGSVAGYQVTSTGTALSATFGPNDGTNFPTAASPLGVAGSTLVYSAVLDRSASSISVFLNGTRGALASASALGSTVGTSVFRIGRASGAGANYQDFEFVAAAVFRRALTASEITTLSNYFTGRIA